jgi:hypothetical protein
MPKINNVTVPCSGYEPGEFYTEEPTNGSYSCKGFAYLIYKKIWGSYTYGTTIRSKSITSSIAAKVELNSLKIGAMINCDRVNGAGNHSMIIIGCNDDEITVYDCNWDGYPQEYCKIATRSWDWDTFVSKFERLSSGYNPT